MTVQLLTLSPTDPAALVGAVMALIAALGTAGGGWFGHRAAQRKIGPEVDQLRDQAAEAITSAARNAVDVVDAALSVSQKQLAGSILELDKLQTALTGLERELAAAREVAATAIADRDAAERRADELAAEVERLRARIDAIEQRETATG